MQLVRFSGVWKDQKFFHKIAKLVRGPKNINRNIEIIVDGTGFPDLPQKQFPVILEHAKTFYTGPDLEEELEILNRLNVRFNAMTTMARATIKGTNRALIVSGPAGLGKSYGVEYELRAGDARNEIVKGYVKATGLYKLLYEYRHQGDVLVFDDADEIFNDEAALNLLKAALDTSNQRWIQWRSETKFKGDAGKDIPQKFLFEGSVIFITNYDFNRMIEKGTKLAPHFVALRSRSHYLDLEMKSERDYMVRIRQVVGLGMLRREGLNAEQEVIILDFIESNINRLQELSLRMAIKLANLFRNHNKEWQDLAMMTCMK